MEYREYKGYYIGKGPNDFHSKAEVDEHIKQKAVESFKNAVELFCKAVDAEESMVFSIYAAELADNLIKYHGFTPDETEAIEIEVMKSVA